MNRGTPEILLLTNSVYPYHLHNVAILSLPFGATYHFRYERRYFHFGSEEIHKLEGKMGMLALRDFERGTFIPLRTFSVLKVDDCGAFIFLDLKFLHFVQYTTSRSEIDSDPTAGAHAMCSEREKYSLTIADQLEARQVANEANQHLAKLILPGDVKELATINVVKACEGTQFTNAWSHIVTILGGMAVYAKVCFYLVGAALELNKGSSAKRFRSRWRAGLVLRTERVYLFRVYQLMGDRTVPQQPGFKMKLSCIEEHLSPLRTELAIDGPYDRLSFFVYVLDQRLETNQSELVFTCDQSVQDPTDSSKSSPLPPSPIELRIQWAWQKRVMKWFVSPLLILTGAILFIFADAIQEKLAYGKIGQYVIQLVALSLLAFGARNWSFLTGSIKSSPPAPRS